MNVLVGTHSQISTLVRRIRARLRVRTRVRQHWALFSIVMHERFRICRKTHNLQSSLIVSLTSYPPRFGTLALTIHSLLQQTVQPDHIVLWIAHEDIQALPEDVLCFQRQGLEICATEDLKSYKKILPALEAFPGAFICTADDDAYYWPTWLEELVRGLDSDDKTVTCHRAYRISLNEDGSYGPYAEWESDVRERRVGADYFPIGVGGILYPPGALAHSPTDRAIISSHCPKGDDIWLYWTGRRNNMRYRTVGRPRHFILWPGTQENGLWLENLFQGNNDKQISAMATTYGFPEVTASPK